MKLSSWVVALAAFVTLGTTPQAFALAEPPAVPPAIHAEWDGDDVVFTFPEGVKPASVSFRYCGTRITRAHIRGHRQAIRWTSPTQMRVAHHFFHKHGQMHRPQGFWVEGEAAGYVALIQFVVARGSGQHD